MAGDLNKITEQDVKLFKDVIDGEMVPYGEKPNNLMDLYQSIATQTAIYPGIGTPLGLDYVALKGAGEAGEFAEHVGKAMRDDGLIQVMEVGTDLNEGKAIIKFRPLTPERRAALIKEIGDQLWYLSAKCNELGIKLSDAALINLQKLSKRSIEGKLGGSGDDR